MQRKKAIEIIEALYPADSQFHDTATIGMELLAQAKHEINDWRNLPESVLVRYAELCQMFDSVSERKSG